MRKIPVVVFGLMVHLGAGVLTAGCGRSTGKTRVDGGDLRDAFGANGTDGTGNRGDAPGDEGGYGTAGDTGTAGVTGTVDAAGTDGHAVVDAGLWVDAAVDSLVIKADSIDANLDRSSGADATDAPLIDPDGATPDQRPIDRFVSLCSPACAANQDCTDGGCIEPQLGGTACETSSECTAGAICCDGSNPACDTTRVSSQDGTDSGQYVKSADGLTVTDNLSGLVWQRDGTGERPGCDSDKTCTWDQAKTYCAGLVLGGLSGWRVPSRMELLSIVDFRNFNPLLNISIFPALSNDRFWTSSSMNTDHAWAFDFMLGLSHADNTSITSNAVRCVRGSRCYPPTRFTIVEGALVHDVITRLFWQQETSAKQMTVANAALYCSSLGAGFRLPTARELSTLVDIRATSIPTIDKKAFPNTPASWFWSSTPYVDAPYKNFPPAAWYVDFTYGEMDHTSVGGENWVRCVR